MNYLWYLLFAIGLYIPLAYSLNLTLGFAGLTVFCHAAFYGIGAYSYAILVTTLGLAAPLAFISAILLTSAVAACVGWVSLRFRGDLFLFVTLGWQTIIFVVLYNWIELTNGPLGISGIPRPALLSLTIQTPFQYVLTVAIIDAFVLAALFAMYKSPFGLTLKALRENEIAAATLGINAQAAYLKAIVLSAGFAAISGALYAAYVTFIDPSSFSLKESFFLVVVVLLGGSGNRSGPILGIIVMVMVPEILRFVGLPASTAANIREIVYGLLLAFLMYFRPQGITGSFAIR